MAPTSVGQLWLLVLVLLVMVVVVLLLLVVVVLVLVLLGSRLGCRWGLGQPVQQQAGRQLVLTAECCASLNGMVSAYCRDDYGAV